jgi:LPXTG-motif cell wall-anchored protein
MGSMMRVIRGAAAIGAVLAIGALFTGVALAQQYPPKAPSVGVSDATVTAGESVTVSGSGWQAGSSVSLSFHSAPTSLGSANVRADGTFSTGVTIPSSASAGTHLIVASGTASNGRQRSVSTEVTVLAAAGASGTTAFTGAQVQTWMVAAAVLLAIGIGLVLASRRRSRVSIDH